MKIWVVGKLELTEQHNIKAFGSFERAFDFLSAYFQPHPGFTKLGGCINQFDDYFEYPVMVKDEYHDGNDYVYGWTQSLDTFFIQGLEYEANN